MKTTPLWTEQQPLPENLTAVDIPATVDVAIVGGGYTGLHASIEIARAGGSVAVFEAYEIGWGASSRNGGMLNPGLKLGGKELFHRFGATVGRQLWDWSLAAIDFVDSFVTDARVDCDFVRSGQVVLAHKPSHFTAMHDEVTWHRTQLDDHVLQVVDSRALGEEIGSPLYFGGVLDARAAGLHPAKYVTGIAQIAMQEGACLLDHTTVTAIRRAGDHFVLQTSRGVLTAHDVLLATNGYTTNLVPQARRAVFAGGSYIITTEPLSPELQASVSPRNRMFYDSKHFLNYFRLTPDGRMLFGGRHNLSTDLDLYQSADELRLRMITLFPQLETTSISHSWTGKLGLTFDLMPHAGRVETGPERGVHYAYGYGGHGVAVASYLGYQMGKLLSGAEVDSPMLGLSHPSFFFTSYEKLYLPLVSAWFRLLDRIS